MSETRTSTALNALKDTQDTSNEFSIVERVARIVSSVYGVKPDYTRLAVELAQDISFDVFGIVLLQHDQKAVRITVCQRTNGSGSEESQWVTHNHRHPFPDSMLARLLHETTLIVKEYPHGLIGSHAESGDALSNYPQLNSTCIVPLRTKERLLGTLELGSTNCHTYSDPLVQRLITAVAQVLSAAIERTQLEGSSDLQDRQREALKDVSRALTSTMDLTTILTHITDGITKALSVASLIVTLDQRQGKVVLVVQTGLDREVLNTIFDDQFILSNQCIVGSTLRNRQTYMSNDIEKDERFPISSILTTKLNIHSVLTSPLFVDSTVYGTLMLCSTEVGGFTPLKSDIVALFATQATLAIHNAMLLEAAQQRNRFQDAVEQLEQATSTQKLSKAKEYALLTRVREEVQRTFGISLSSMLRFVSDNLLTRNERNGNTLSQGAVGSGVKQHTVDKIPDGHVLFSKPEDVEPPLRSGDPLSLLTQTSQAVLARTGIVSELSTLLMQMQHPTNGIKDAWLVASTEGKCVYMNPVAEALCHIRQVDIEKTPMLLKLMFSQLLPYIRNAEEVLHYLQDFAQSNLYKQELRCIIAQEPLPNRDAFYEKQLSSDVAGKRESYGSRRSTPLLRTMVLENAPSDTYYLFSRHPLYNSQGQRTAYALQVHDITTQVRDEKNKSALLSSVSHDLRTPLTTIKAAVTGLLQADAPWDEKMRREMLEDIDSETDHLTVLVSSLVEMSRLEMGAMILEKEWCDITEVVYTMLIKAKRITANRSVKTQFQCDLPLLFIDYVQVERVLFNLVENAARYSPENGNIHISTDSIVEETGQEMVRVRIVDEGCGIPTDEQERVFKSFYRLNSHGSGLGLAICKGIIELHHGHIWVEPTEGGSCVVFTLPIEQTA